MKVKELIAELQKFDPEMDIVTGCCESGGDIADIRADHIKVDPNGIDGKPCVVINEMP